MNTTSELSSQIVKLKNQSLPTRYTLPILFSLLLESDIKGFYDHVNQAWQMKFLKHRIGDERVLRLIVRMLKSGVLENGLIQASVRRRFKRTCRGAAYYFRYADDFLACFQYHEDAERFLKELAVRLAQFSLELEPAKTKLIEFGRFAVGRTKRTGWKLGTFEFLGFTHYCGQTRMGHFKVKRKTSKKKYRTKLREMKEWLQRERSRMKKGELLRQAKLKLAGHLNYYAITDNEAMCSSFRYQVERLCTNG